MFKSLIIMLLSGSVAIMGFAGLAQANRRDCAMPIMKGGCPVVLPLPGPQLPKTQGT